MLTYLINVTDDLLAVSVVIGVIFAFISQYCMERGRLILRAGLGLGVVAAGVRAYITNTRRLVGGWRVGTIGYGIVVAMVLVAVIAGIVLLRKLASRPADAKDGGSAEIILATVAGLLVAAYLYNALPEVFVYPFKFDTSGDGILNSDFLLRLGGYLLGLIVCLVSAVAACRVVQVLGRKGHGGAVTGAFLVTNLVYMFCPMMKLFSVLIVRKYMSGRTLFKIATFSNNHAAWYTYAMFAVVAVLGIYLFISSATSHEPYRTNAEHRRQKAVWRTGKRHAVSLYVCFVLGILCATLFVTLNTVVIKEAPVEEPIIIKGATGEDETLCVPLEMVSDGHLHRFGYTTADGTLTRFIVILKQAGTNNYGVGLDACEICGEAGYYENKDGQVVCKKCNVVMNTTTIGMKGGCNPIIIEYDIDDTGIVVPVTEMVNNQSRFK